MIQAWNPLRAAVQHAGSGAERAGHRAVEPCQPLPSLHPHQHPRPAFLSSFFRGGQCPVARARAVGGHGTVHRWHPRIHQGTPMKIDLPERKKLVHEMRFPVRWGDMDAMGHVNNTVYFRYLETARIDWMV